MPKQLKDIFLPVLFFLLGAVALTLLAQLQHRIFGDSHSWETYLVPCLVGGIGGVFFYIMRQQTKELASQLSTLCSATLYLKESSLPARKKTAIFFLLLFTTLAGCLLVSALSIVQRLISDYPINLKGFAVPILVGSTFGFLCGLYLNKLKRFQSFQTAAISILSNEKKRLSHIIETIRDGILVTNKCGENALVNPACLELLGTREEELQTIDLWDSLKSLISPYETNQFTIPLYNVPFLVQARQTGKILRGTVNPLKNEAGENTGLVLVLQDRSHEKKIEQMKAEFITTATHELNTPISALAGYAELILDSRFSPEQHREFIETIGQKAWQVSNLLDEMLNVGTPQLIILDKVKLQISEIMTRVEEYSDKARGSHVLKLDIQDQENVLDVDVKRIKRIFCHLLSNAAKFSTAGSNIIIRGHAEEDRYLFEIEDQGRGMSAEESERAFDKFFRADASDTALEGMGLGLSVVKTLVEAHGGEILIDSLLNRGTRVQFSLPLS